MKKVKARSKERRNCAHSGKTPMAEGMCGWHEVRRKGVKSDFLHALYQALKEEAEAKRKGDANDGEKDRV